MPTIFVVDDDPDVLNSLKFLLETEGFAVKTFPDGLSLLSSPLPGPADCLVLDYKMKGMDGLQLMHQLRSRGVTAPVILITVFENVVKKALAEGAARVLVKPLLEDNLVARIRELMKTECL